MKKEAVSIQKINGFSTLLLDFLSGKSELKPFYQLPPAIESFGLQINQKASFSKKNRQTLVQVLKSQYETIGHRTGIDSLENENTFTVTTGHQLNLFTGPLYVIYKIISTIKLARQLKQAYPQYNFVPIYWLASEDHDFEEINHFYWKNTKHQWDSSQKGAVGRFILNDLSPLFKLFPDDVQFFKEAYSQSKNLSEAVIRYMDHLFGAEGLICLDADQPALKALFTEVIQADVLHQAHEGIVQQTTKGLQDLGYKTQVNARPINFFYLGDQLRERIEQEGDNFVVQQTNLRFSTKEIQNEIKSNPERFSPNVILRPLYQECILPNLAYLGGPAEIVYWLQLKGVFDLHQVPFPILLPRNFATVVEDRLAQKWQKLGLSWADLFASKEELKQRVLQLFSNGTYDVSEQKKQLESVFNELESIANAIDKSLIQSVRSHLQVSKNAFERIQHKFKKAELRNHADGLHQIQAVIDQLFPGGTWQERRDNFLNFYLSNPSFIQDLLENFDPFSFDMNFLILQDGSKA